ncbi:hypothetical protein IMY05_006G0077600 [Salix suchowensis]|nr:hypothetical protein IMY05_006G0077600 [Salix suchowensis]
MESFLRSLHYKRQAIKAAERDYYHRVLQNAQNLTFLFKKTSFQNKEKKQKRGGVALTSSQESPQLSFGIRYKERSHACGTLPSLTPVAWSIAHSLAVLSVSFLAVSKEYEETRRLEDNDDDSSAPSGLRDDRLLFYVFGSFSG